LQAADYSLVSSLTGKMLGNAGIESVPGSLSYQLLSRELMKALLDVLKVRILRSTGDYSKPDHEVVPMLKRQTGTVLSVPVGIPEEATPLTFSEIQEQYLAEVTKAEVSLFTITDGHFFKLFDVFRESQFSKSGFA